MPFIKVQRLERGEDGSVIKGTASIVDVYYDKNGKGKNNHSKQVPREPLGKIIYLTEDKKSGIFLSPTRGMVEYSSRSDSFAEVDSSDPRLNKSELFPVTQVHTVFGDTFLLLKVFEKTGLLSIFQSVFSKKSDFERFLCHTMHGILKDGSKITCDNFIQKSFLSYLCSDIPISTLKSDFVHFSTMGNDKIKMGFFKEFITAMRLKNPNFGRGCYVDSTPLPNDIVDNPFNALCCHGVSSCQIQTRLVLVLDEETGLPIWYDIIPGNVLDINTLQTELKDVKTSLDIDIKRLILDAGYISKELIQLCPADSCEHKFIGRMPARRGFPFMALYRSVKDLTSKGKYRFVRNGYYYFGHRREITVFGVKEYAYVYVDIFNADRKCKDYIIEHEDEYSKLPATKKDWLTVKFGFFVLISNIEDTPEQILTEYYGRTEIETVFKTSKEYLQLLPINKWTDATVRGKILQDIINTIALLVLRKEKQDPKISMSEIYGKAKSLMCFCNENDTVIVETPNKKVKQYYSLYGIKVPSQVQLQSVESALFDHKM